ncbi:MAG: tripeptide aminopeptidase [Glaciecola sp.]|jgi:tripeptide aminopeptidase|uniref:M20/M25/M40 family metallo-hydrolase n=1 Tax=Congregibacter sp. TaxID=2744308 RepID=UPI0039E6444C
MRFWRGFSLSVITFCVVSASWAQQDIVTIDSAVDTQFSLLREQAKVQQALAHIEAQESAYLEELIRLTEIPAPPFKEERRAAYFLEQMKSRGLSNAYIDDTGNVIGIRKGTGNGPTFLIAAHLDTVFPEDIDTTVTLRDGRYYAPGIGDDTRGLAALLSVIEALETSGIETVGDIIFAGNVGEEGRGDLRGVKGIFRDHPEIDGFVSIDGVKMRRITNGGTGSRRFEFHFNGPGGHSFGAFGLASATHAMGRAIAKIGDIETPTVPKTTFTVGTVMGGTSVNSIAAHAVFALDMRSNDKDALAELEKMTKAAALAGVAEENARWNNGEISVEFKLIGDRPVGSTPVTSALVQAAALAYDAVDVELEGLGISSTDSNVPMSLGIPAVTLSAGGDAGGAHSPDEWYAPLNSYKGPQSALLVMLAMTGISGVSEPLLEQR